MLSAKSYWRELPAQKAEKSDSPSPHQSLASVLRQEFCDAICLLRYLGRTEESISNHITMATGELVLAFHSARIQQEDTLFLGNKTVNNNTV